MAKEPTTLKKLRRLPWSMAADAGNTAFLQLTFMGSVFVLFLDELGLSKSTMGVLLSLLPFAAAAAPVIAPRVAQLGYKRSYLLFFGARSIIAALLLFTPWVMGQFGSRTALLYIGTIVGLFAILRAFGVTAMGPWAQEYVPNQIRGRYSAMDTALQGTAGFLVLMGATYLLGRIEGLWGFMLLIGIGVLFGLGATASGTLIPGGAPESDSTDASVKDEIVVALKDRDYLRYLGSLGLTLFAIMPIISFLPLFMKEQVGLSDGQVVFLQAGTLLGGLLTSYLWGWAADRYGSKPVMTAGLVFRWLLPLGWLLIPRLSPWSLYIAAVIALFQGVGKFGWVTGSKRLRYVNIVPPERKNGYMALFVAWSGVVGGVSRLFGGWLLDQTQGLYSRLGPLVVDPYTPLFLIGLTLPLVSFYLLRGVDTDDQVEPGEFARMFVRGRPLLALLSLVGFYRAKDELTAVSMTARLGRAKSPLAVEELVAALHDPRFHVRFEAIVAIAHSKPDPRLTDALVGILQGKEPVLNVLAAWALGRLGDARAQEPLRAGLDAPYKPVQGYSARSLGLLGDDSIVPTLLERLPQEEDPALRIAYASTLGKFQVAEAAPLILDLLRTTDDDTTRKEMALALARIVGQEQRFLQLMRQAEEDSSTATAQALLTISKSVHAHHTAEANGLVSAMEQCAESLAGNDLASGVTQMRDIIHRFPQEDLDDVRVTVLRSCRQCLEERPDQTEYLLLALLAMQDEAAPNHSLVTL